MFIYSAKMDKRKLIMIAVGIVVAVVALILIFRGGGDGGEPRPGVTQDTYREQMKLLKESRLSENADCITLLTALGWEVNIQPLEKKEVMIPEEFSEVYQRYNEIQEEQGLNLARYKGKRVIRYTYEIVNYPTGEQNVQATLLVYKNKLIGGDICSARLDGFMHTLLVPTDETSSRDPAATSAAQPSGGVLTEEYKVVDIHVQPDDVYPAD